ncbi:MAG TPA: excinuclease ABC subunit UvrA [Deltaproteobacteria bacterium]|nr:MAG: excinuclease ABC subunit A [Deltaproteobacteria bacterium GWA2_45_12]HBF13229.1 excinuclease ABC subunit UvrA [Deltaproteobacteria bacterium]
MEPKYIFVKGARQHNLKNIDVKIPRNQLVVITGLSGSGKSSLAFDTIYAEGQRRYVESLSAYARQFLEQMGKPDVDFIEGLSPAISIEQKAASHNPRSTVGTVTEIYDYLRLLFARIGKVYCHECGKPITAQTITQMVDRVMELPEGTKLFLLAPIVRARKGEYHRELNDLKKQGFSRVRIDDVDYELDATPILDKKKKHTIELFVDRLVLKKGLEQRLADSFETAVKFSGGLVKVEVLSDKTHFLFSTRNACVDCGISYPEIEPQLFSFNSPQGACPTCDGLGHKMFFDPELVVPNPNLSLREGAIAPWAGKSAVYYTQVFISLAKHYSFNILTSFKDLPKKIRDVLMFGSGEEEIQFSIEKGEGRHYYKAPFEGVIASLSRKYQEATGDWFREELEKFMNIQPCPACDGSRLKKESLSIRIGNKNIHELTAQSTLNLKSWFKEISWTKTEMVIAKRILKELEERLGFLVDVGLDYLTLDRASSTLSGGEAQRIRLASQIGSSLMGVMYVLDEPSIGLHQRDNDRLIATLKKLRDLGNTVLVVEHDEDTICQADHVIDMGPGAGSHGGHIVAQGSPQAIEKNKNSLTGQYLSGKKEIPIPSKRRTFGSKKIILKEARCHNLKNVDVPIPLGMLVGITGVSGSGKSSLINDTLYPALCQHLYHSRMICGPYSGIEGLDHIDKVVNIDQSPIGRTPRSNPATYTGLFSPLRDLFAELPESKARGYRPGRYSFNVKGGRCEACEGDGVIRIEMHFLPDVYVQCDQCHGRRYNRETLEIQYKGKNISEILSMTVEQGSDFLKNIPSVHDKLATLIEVGLDYIELGQSATTLSGGEAQRIKLAKELSKRATGRTLYILDEPTTGLHFEDILKLLHVLNKLVDAGNTVIVIEHNLDVIKSCDYLIDLGPEGGDRGGNIVAVGTPEEIAKNKNSFTGHYLKKIL